MTYSKKEAQRVRQKVSVGTALVTGLLDAATTVEVLSFGGAMSKVTFQGTDTLAGTVEFSVNGINWFSSTAIGAANAAVSFSTHNFNSMRVTRSGGSGQLAIAATA